MQYICIDQIHGADQSSSKSTRLERALTCRSPLLISQLLGKSISTPAMLHHPVALHHPSNTPSLTISGQFHRPQYTLEVVICIMHHVVFIHSCMLDSKSDPGGSQFISRTDKTLRFSLKAFQFTFDPDTEVSIIVLCTHNASFCLTRFPFSGQYSLQSVCHGGGPGSCPQIMHLHSKQVSAHTIEITFDCV